MQHSTKWTRRYLNLAKHVSQWSKDPSTKVGAVIIGNNGEVLAQGYNGFPRLVKDTKDRLNDQKKKYRFIVHAELNCIYHAARIGLGLHGATMFIFGLPPCNECIKGIIQAGITSLVFETLSTDNNSNWLDNFNLSKTMLDEAGVSYTMYK